MRRKILSLFLAIVLVLGTMTNIVFATDTQVHTAQFFNSATDESVDDLNDASSVYADLNFTAPITGEASVIAALYDVNEYFKEAVILGTINMMQGEVAQYHTPDITIGDAQMLKIFVWVGLTSMEPMTDASVISRKIESGGSGSDVEIETGVTTENISLSTQNASAEIPMGVAVSGDTDVLTLSMEVMSTSQSGVEAGEDEELSSVDVHIEGISKDNTVPIIVTLQNVVEGGFNEGNINLYHVEEDKTKKMTRVNSEAELDAHNEYLYNPVDGTLKLALASFSEIAILSDTNNA